MKQLFSPSQNRTAGFTLIEMLISVVIMLALVGGGIAAFITFNDRQTVLAGAKDLKLSFRSAQIKARAAERPDLCDSLQAYAVQMTAGSGQVTTSAICANGDYTIDSYLLKNDVVSQDTIDVQFLVLHGGVRNPGTVTLAKGSHEYSLTVTQGGEITE
jgi:prepilin-type N-terminal cleavage/methylation domain-containing protein